MAEPATLIASRVVRADRVEAFGGWAARVDGSAVAAPGHLGTLRLDQSGGVVHLVYRFADEAALAAWEASDGHEALMKEGEAIALPLRQTATGAHATFTLPGEADAAKWKKWLLTWAAVFPMLLLLNTAVGFLPVKLPQPVQVLVTSLPATALLTWFILPKVTRWAKTWILEEDGEARNGKG